MSPETNKDKMQKSQKRRQARAEGGGRARNEFIEKK